MDWGGGILSRKNNNNIMYSECNLNGRKLAMTNLCMYHGALVLDGFELVRCEDLAVKVEELNVVVLSGDKVLVRLLPSLLQLLVPLLFLLVTVDEKNLASKKIYHLVL